MMSLQMKRMSRGFIGGHFYRRAVRNVKTHERHACIHNFMPDSTWMR